MNRNDLLHRLAEGETVTIHDVDECIREEKSLLADRAIEWLYTQLHNGYISVDSCSVEELMKELKFHLTH